VPRSPKAARVALLGATGVAVLALGAVLGTRAFPRRHESAVPAVAVAATSTAGTPGLRAPVAGRTPVTAPAGSPSATAQAASVASAQASAAAGSAQPAVPVLPVISEAKHLNVPALRTLTLGTAAPSGPLRRKVPVRKSVAQRPATPSEPELPASGL
jgi:hypothetical protein